MNQKDPHSDQVFIFDNPGNFNFPMQVDNYRTKNSFAESPAIKQTDHFHHLLPQMSSEGRHGGSKSFLTEPTMIIHRNYLMLYTSADVPFG